MTFAATAPVTTCEHNGGGLKLGSILSSFVYSLFGENVLLDENGNMIAYFPSKVTPMSEEIGEVVGYNRKVAKAQRSKIFSIQLSVFASLR